jgi:hemerythrin-like domain-containing protein
MIEKIIKTDTRLNRRNCIKTFGTAGIGWAVIGCSGSSPAGTMEKSSGELHEITPAEDLMFEHGVIERLLLIYNDAVRRIKSGGDISPELISDTADIIRRFTENYHEKLEEQYVFPRLEKMGRHTELVKILLKQHKLGREVTDNIRRLVEQQETSFGQLAKAMESYSFMYIPHISRENSVVFRTLRESLPEDEYIELGEKFEQMEDAQLGKSGYMKNLKEIMNIEIKLNIYDLTRFNPVV